MKIAYSVVISLALHSVLVLPISAKNKINTKATTLKISKIEVVPSKVKEQVVVTRTKTFHGKAKDSKTVKPLNTKPVENNKAVDRYLLKVRQTIIENYTHSSKAKKMKLKGKVLAKIQIQKNGQFDVLYVGGDHPVLDQMTQATLEKITKFKEIPEEAGQQEIQLKVPLVFDFSK